MHILLVEDNRDLAQNILEYFKSGGDAVDLAEDGISGLHMAIARPYDALLLDLALPGLDGLVLCRRLRDAGKQTPVLMLTARDALEDKIAGLEAEADDYVVKPCALREVDARLRALVRRAQVYRSPARLQVGDLVLDTATREVTRGERNIKLPPIPLKILESLMRHAPRVVSREELERSIWGDSRPDSDALRAHLHILRNAVDSRATNPLIKTRRGLGYQISGE